ncbi:GNAT family N-acetyltransferase [bacterium]|nr:GNAT family N-acetyltransferase [bacterium]
MAGVNTYKVQLETPSPSLSAELTAHLMQDLLASNEQAENTEFTLIARNEANEIIAGLTAITSYGWMLIKVLWVNRSERRCGIGQRLMNDAVSCARSVGCHGIWLDTSSPEAFAFYTAQKFEVFGVLTNKNAQLPTSHHRWFLRKQIDQ